MTEYNPEDEEIDLADIELHEDPSVGPHPAGSQDDPTRDEQEEQEDPDA